MKVRTETGINLSKTLLAYDNDQVVGLIRGISDEATILYIQDLLVLPNYQHQGIGTALLTTFLDHFDSVNQVILTAENSQQAISFYEKQGLVRMAKEYGQAFVMDRR